MICKSCVESDRPRSKGSHYEHFCEACGFALTETGDRIRSPQAAMLVAIGESGDRFSRYGLSEQERADGWSGAYTDPHLLALDAARKLAST